MPEPHPADQPSSDPIPESFSLLPSETFQRSSGEEKSGAGETNVIPPFPLAERRVAPHWSLLAASLILFAFLVYMMMPYLSPFTLSLGILLLLYPSRRIRAIKPLLFLSLVVALITMWWRLGSLLTPFLISMVIAYILHPFVEWFVRHGVPRWGVIFALVVLILVSLASVGWFIVPRLWEEVTQLGVTVPSLIDQVRQWGSEVVWPWVRALNIPIDKAWGEAQPKLPDLLGKVFTFLTQWSTKAVGSIMNIVAGLLNLVLIPVISIYLLVDYDKVKAAVLKVVPAQYRPAFQLFYQRANVVMMGFFRGQLLVILFLSTWIGLGLILIANLPYGLMLGVAAGFMNLIPYVGTTVALIITLIVSLLQPEPIWTALKALLVFISAQSIEGNLLTPKLVGDRVGLHPLVVIFVVLLFAYLFGFIGMLIAIPVTALGKVLWRLGVETGWKFILDQGERNLNLVNSNERS